MSVRPLPGTRQPGHGEYAEKFPGLDASPQVAVGAAAAKAAVRRPLAGPRARVPLVIREGNLVTEVDDLLGAGCRGFAPNELIHG